MNAKVIGIVIGVVVLVLGGQKQERRATLYAIAENMPDCNVSTVYVNDVADCITYTTKNGKSRGFSVE